MLLNLQPQTGLPVSVETQTCEFLIGERLNSPTFCTRTVRDLDPVWANPVAKENRVIYCYTSPLWFPEDAAIWKEASIGYGIVYFPPGIYGGEYVKSSGQYHSILQGETMASPEIYSVLMGTGHFMLQRSTPPYDDITDAVLVEAETGETLIVPPDYGHLQINPTEGPLAFSYTVMHPLTSNYEPYRRFRGAMYYEMADSPARFVFNPRYPYRVPLRVVQATELQQVSFLRKRADYGEILRCLPELGFITRPEKFPAEAYV